MLLTGILPWAGCGSETAEIPVSRAGRLVFLTPAGSTRHDDGQQLLVILQPLLLIHKGLAKLGKFLKIFAAWWFIQTEQASPHMRSSRAAGMGLHGPARQAEKEEPGHRECLALPRLLSRPLALLCAPELVKSCTPSCIEHLPEASKTSPGGVNLRPGSFIS